MQRLFLINGLSPSALKYWKKNASKILSSVSNGIAVQSNHKKSFVDSIQKGLKSGFDQMIAVGGDGTIGLMADTLIREANHDTTIACLPAGTGCDFYRSISQGWSPQQLLTEGIDAKIDVLSAELDQHRTVFGVNSLSIGMSADIVHERTKLSPYTPKQLAYLAATLKRLPKTNAQTYSFTLNQTKFHEQALAVIITKGLYAGGGMKLGESFNHASGKFSCKIIQPFQTKGLAQGLRHVYFEGISSLPFVHNLEGSQFMTHSPLPINVEIDGELYICNHLKVTVRRSALKVLVHPSHESRRLQLVKK